jgi:hypothetical protein
MLRHRQNGVSGVKREDSRVGCVNQEFYIHGPESAEDRFGKFAETGTHLLEDL